MAKKPQKSKAAPKRSATRGNASSNGARHSRKERYDGRRLTRVADRLREQAARLGVLAKQIQEGDFEAVDVDGHAMLLRGLNQIDNFTDNAARAVREASQANLTI
jgi:hypothetical protein